MYNEKWGETILYMWLKENYLFPSIAAAEGSFLTSQGL